MGGQLRVDVHTEIRANWRQPVLFSGKEVCVFIQELRLWHCIKRDNFYQYKLVT